MEHRVDAFYGSQAKESNEIGTTRLPLGSSRRGLQAVDHPEMRPLEYEPLSGEEGRSSKEGERPKQIPTEPDRETGNSSRMARSKNEASVQSSAGFEVPVRLPPEGVPRYQGVMAQYAMNLKDKWR
ncbi:hypothetical protein EPH_0012250 [Eimeria praecox]|uniref:Uncharacterized protein n=1 Tax=Eimeria praecox TaxID=51316 RepID=U6G4Y7_9EIME|nr:hypothetical protein EPH_0012250 [Eimeria praecox]